MPVDPGTRLGPYEILSLLGAGGMGEVYRARDTRLNRDVAIKILPKSMSRDEARRARFEHEAQAVAALSHPNVLGSLRDRLRHGPIAVRKAVEWAAGIAHRLAAAHEKQVVRFLCVSPIRTANPSGPISPPAPAGSSSQLRIARQTSGSRK